MHESAHRWLWTILSTLPPRHRVCELGSRVCNGSVRELFPSARIYVGVDLVDGPGVDVVADAATWRPQPEIIGDVFPVVNIHTPTFDTALACELLEHAPAAEAICRTLYDVLEPGGVALVTAATEPREPHACDGGKLEEGHYRNVAPEELRAWLGAFAVVLIDTGTEGDVYALAVKGCA